MTNLCLPILIILGTRRSESELRTYRGRGGVAPDARVLTEETLGASIDQPYIKLWRASSSNYLERVRPDYIVTYNSTTQAPPKSKALDDLLNKSQVIATFSGFKETYKVYKVG